MQLFKKVIQSPLILLLMLVTNSVSASETLINTKWVYDHGFGCVTTITFLDDKRYVLESAEQFVIKEYELSRYSDTKYYLLEQRTEANNNQLSCSGIKAGRIGSIQRAYIKFSLDGMKLTFSPKPSEDSPVKVVYEKQPLATNNSN